MKFTARTLLALLGAAAATPMLPRDIACTANRQTGSCRSSAQGCAGGSFVAGTGPPYPCPGSGDIQCCVGGPAPPAQPSGAALPSLSSVQPARARDVIAAAVSANVGRQGCLAAVTTAITESNIQVYANEGVPESLSYPYDAIGSDHDSIGIFQQRACIYTNISAIWMPPPPPPNSSRAWSPSTAGRPWTSAICARLCSAPRIPALTSQMSHSLLRFARWMGSHERHRRRMG
jgi:hypothetical protein